MLLDVLHIHSAFDIRHLVQLTSVAPDVRVIDHSLLVRLEVAYQHRD